MDVEPAAEEVTAPAEEVPATTKVFDLEKQKHVALAALPQRARESPAFKQFFKSQLADDYLCAALDHFAALLRVEDMKQQRVAGKKTKDIPPPSAEETQAESLLQDTIKEVSAYYCYTIMQFSRYSASQQDRMFFESLYEFIAAVVCAAFPPHHKARVEDEMARILRTDTFNLSARKNDPNHHTKMYFTSRELYTLRHAGGGHMGQKILAALHPRRHPGEPVTVVIQRRSPLAAQLLPSAADIAKVARAARGDGARSSSRLSRPGASSPAAQEPAHSPSRDALRAPSGPAAARRPKGVPLPDKDKVSMLSEKRGGARSAEPWQAAGASLSTTRDGAQSGTGGRRRLPFKTYA